MSQGRERLVTELKVWQNQAYASACLNKYLNTKCTLCHQAEIRKQNVFKAYNKIQLLTVTPICQLHQKVKISQQQCIAFRWYFPFPNSMHIFPDKK